MIDEEAPDSEGGREGNIEGTIKAVTGLVKEVPIYEDAIQPVAKEAGKALQTVGRTVNAVLLPIKGLVWGVEQIEEFVQSRVTKKLENTPVEDICTPDPAVAGPVLESLRYTGHKESLSELYANLLASAMDRNTAKNAHPGFVEIIRNMSSDEAKLMENIIKRGSVPIIDVDRKLLKPPKGTAKVLELISMLGDDANLEHKDLVPSYLINLERLGLIEIRRDSWLTKEEVYTPLIESPVAKSAIEQLNKFGGDEFKGSITKYHAKATVFGQQFSRACVVSRDKT